jgi:hypothetical protein
MKNIILTIALLMSAARAQAQVKTIDLDAPLKDARMGISWIAGQSNLGTAYVALISFNGNKTGQEYVTLNGGVSDKLRTGKVGYVASIGFRADTIFAWLAGGKFAKKYLRFAVLPPIEICVGPLTDDFRHFRPALTIAKKF